MRAGAAPALLDAARDSGPAILADGFSCRTQIAQLSPYRAHHLAELLADGLPIEGPADSP
ncbi:hypothetical protein GCM10020254_47850 [Streptomyces goshikiensis]